MKLPSIPLYYAKDFSWKGKSGTTFASDLGCRCGTVPGGQIYDDACDYGFHLEGKGRTILFVLSNTLYDREHELSGWEYTSAEGEFGGEFKLTIFND